MKLGIFTVAMPDYTPEEAIRRAYEIGCQGLEWRITKDAGDPAKPSFWSGNRTSMTAEQLLERAEALKSEAAKYAIAMPSLGTYISCEDPEKVELSMRAAKALGASSLRVNAPAYKEDQSWEDQLAAARKSYAAVEELAKKYSVRALLETHMGLFTYSVATARTVLEGLSPEYTGIMWDPGNQVKEGLERCEVAVRSAGAYLGEVHVKNMAWRPVNVRDGSAEWICEFVPIPLGQVNWPQVIAVLKKAGYDGWYMLEDFSTLSPLHERLEEDIRYMRRILER